MSPRTVYKQDGAIWFRDLWRRKTRLRALSCDVDCVAR